MDGKIMASKIINCVFEEADYTIENLGTVKSEYEIASVYTALVAYFLAAYQGEYDISNNLTDAFQRKIGRQVTAEEIDGYSKIFSDAYVRFSERGVMHKSMTAAYEEDFSCYVDIMTDMTGVYADEDKSKVLSLIYELYKMASRAGRGDDPVEPIKPPVVISVLQLLALILLYFFIWAVYKTVDPAIHEIWIVMTEKLMIFNDMIYSFFMPFPLVLFISFVYSRIFRGYLLNYHCGNVFLIIVFVHAIYDIRHTCITLRRDSDIPILFELIFYTILFLRTYQFVKPRTDKDLR